MTAVNAHHLGDLGEVQPALAVMGFAIQRWLVVAPQDVLLIDGATVCGSYAPVFDRARGHASALSAG